MRRKIKEVIALIVITLIVIGFAVGDIFLMSFGKQLLEVDYTWLSSIYFGITMFLYAGIVIMKWKMDPDVIKKLIKEAQEKNEAHISRKITIAVLWTLFVATLGVMITISRVKEVEIVMSITIVTAQYLVILSSTVFGGIFNEAVIEHK